MVEGYFNMFLKKKYKEKNINVVKVKKPMKRRKKITLFVLLALFVVLVSYVAYLYASGKKIFDTGNLTASPFFKKLSGEEYTLKGEGDGRINILVLGMGGENHPGGQLTDSIMVLSINPDDKTMAMLSIPRDLYVPIPGTKISKKINEVYKTGEDKKEGTGGEFAKETIGKILDLPLHYYLTVDFYGFKKIIDEVGGIDVNVEKAIYDPLYPAQDMKGYESFKIKAGQQHLDGATALKYARSRETSSDFDRAARQQKVLQALREKLSNKGFLVIPKNIANLIKIVSEHVRTDFSLNEISALAKLAEEIDYSKTVSKVLSNGNDGELVSDSSSGTYRLLPKGGKWEIVQRVAHEIFTDPDLKKESAQIEVVNGSKTSGLAGKLAETLKSYNYTIVSIITGKATAKTTISDYTNGTKPVTIEFLEKRLGVESIKLTRPSNSTNIDISITIGDDYKGFTKDPTSD